MNKEDLLYNYFSNTLNTQQIEEFNALLKNDAAFLEQFTFEKDLQKGVQFKKKEELKAKLQGFEKEIKVKKLTPKMNYKIWAMAASVALLLGFAWFNISNSTPNFDTLYASNFKSYPNTVFSITRGDTINSIERKAFVAYEKGDYKTAQLHFLNLKEKTDASILKSDVIDFYLAMSFVNANNLEEAKNIFTTISHSKNQFTSESLWYLALINIKEKDQKSALVHLKELTNTFDFNKNKAKALLEELN